MTNADIDLAELVRGEVAKQSGQFQIMVVDSVQESGAVNLKWGEATLNGIAANVSYNPRTEGDVVLVLNHKAGWRVIDKIGSPKEDAPASVGFDYGAGTPGGDYVEAQMVWVKKGSIYIQTGVGPGEEAVPEDTSFSANSATGYRDGSKDNSRLGQGAWPSYPHPLTTMWAYGDNIMNACAGLSVGKIEVRVARTSKYHGVSGQVKPRLGVITEGSPPNKTPSLSRKWVGPGIGLGQSKWVTIPGDAAAALASGAAKGIGISASTSKSQYMLVTAGCGGVRISFTT